MRTEKEMMGLILHTAKTDDRIRAVYMNGSRTNPNVPKDIFQDYDIVYVVTETASFIENEKWIHAFGDLLMIQEPDKIDMDAGAVKERERSYGYLMLFTDGNRIDLHIETKEAMAENYMSDKLTVPLLDKDNCLSETPPPSDADYQVKTPTEHEYLGCCNNFWWCLQNVAKGLWRDEMPYAKSMFELVVRNDLDKMVSWWIGSKTDFSVSTGKMGKYFKKYLPKQYWEMYEGTYADHKEENVWNAVFVSCELFRKIAQDVAEHSGFTYSTEDDANMTLYLEHVRNLRKDAEEIIK